MNIYKGFSLDALLSPIVYTLKVQFCACDQYTHQNTLKIKEKGKRKLPYLRNVLTSNRQKNPISSTILMYIKFFFTSILLSIKLTYTLLGYPYIP